VNADIAQRRRNRAAQGVARPTPTYFNRVLTELEPLTEQTHNLEVFQVIHAVAKRHGTEPHHPADALATTAGFEPDTHRVLDQMVNEGLAAPPPDVPQS